MQAFELDPAKIRDIAPEVLDHNGRLKVMPADYWATTSAPERAMLGHRHAIYSFPTIELVAHLKDLIDGRSAIEIGAGHGVLAQALGIPATDSRLQNRAHYRAYYAAIGQPTIKYGRNVNEMDARSAIRRYQPDVVIGCWVTHRYDSQRRWAGGNPEGIDEGELLTNVKQYIFVGNDEIHKDKAIWHLPHTKTRPPFIYSRACNGTPDFLAIWEGSK